MTSCGNASTSKTEETEPAETTTEATTTTTEATTTTTETTQDMTKAVIKLGSHEYTITIKSITLEDGVLSIDIGGLDVTCYTDNLYVEVLIDDEGYFLESSRATQEGYIRTSDEEFDEKPDQIWLYNKNDHNTLLIYDVAKGEFIDATAIIADLNKPET